MTTNVGISLTTCLDNLSKNDTSSFEMNMENRTHVQERIEVRIEWQTSSMIFAVMDIILMLFICAGNCFVLNVVFRNISLHTYSNYFIVQLSVADLVVGFCMPLNVVAHEHRYFFLEYFCLQGIIQLMVQAFYLENNYILCCQKFLLHVLKFFTLPLTTIVKYLNT